MIRTGNLDEEGLSSPYTTIPNTKINDDDAAQLALEAAQQYAIRWRFSDVLRVLCRLADRRRRAVCFV